MQFPSPKYILLSSPFQISIKLNIDLFILKESFRKEEIIYMYSDGNRLFSTLLVATLKIIMLGQTAGESLNQFLQGIKKSFRKEDLKYVGKLIWSTCFFSKNSPSFEFLTEFLIFFLRFLFSYLSELKCKIMLYCCEFQLKVCLIQP